MDADQAKRIEEKEMTDYTKLDNIALLRIIICACLGSQKQ